MKRTLILITALFLVFSASGAATAEMLNVGTVVIDRSDLEDIQNRVSGIMPPNQTNPTARKPADLNIGVTTMSVADYAALQDYVSGRKEMPLRSGKAPGNDSVGPGVVEISQSDLHDMKQLTGWMKKKGPGRLFDAPLALLR